MRVLAVTANKGGVGKSTLAFQVAAELARRGLRVLAVDADKQADLTRYARGPRLAGMGLDAVLADPPASLDPRPYIGSVSPKPHPPARTSARSPTTWTSWAARPGSPTRTWCSSRPRAAPSSSSAASRSSPAPTTGR